MILFKNSKITESQNHYLFKKLIGLEQPGSIMPLANIVPLVPSDSTPPFCCESEIKKGYLENKDIELFANKELVGVGFIIPLYSIFIGSADAFTFYASSLDSYTSVSISSPIYSFNPSLLITIRRSFIRSFIKVQRLLLFYNLELSSFLTIQNILAASCGPSVISIHVPNNFDKAIQAFFLGSLSYNEIWSLSSSISSHKISNSCLMFLLFSVLMFLSIFFSVFLIFFPQNIALTIDAIFENEEFFHDYFSAISS